MPPPRGRSVTHVSGMFCYPHLNKGIRNLHNTHEERELAESSGALAICLSSPRFATFCIGLGPNLGPQESQLSDANVGGCWKAAVKSDTHGSSRRRKAILFVLPLKLFASEVSMNFDPRSIDDSHDRDVYGRELNQ